MTMQRHDTVIYKGKEQITISQPLESYFKFINKKPIYISLNTSLMSRGYYADWLINENKLFLIDFKGYQLQSNWTEAEYNLNDLFPDIEKPVHASWFSSTILLPNGQDISKSSYPIHTSFLKLTFKDGILLSEIVEVNNARTKAATF